MGRGDFYATLTSSKDGLPCVAVVNQSLVGFEDKASYAWHLSVIIDAEELGEHGMPTHGEVLLLEAEGDRIEDAICGEAAALFLGRTTWNGTRQIHFRVRDPHPTHATLQRLVAEQRETRQWDFKMWHDPEWGEAAWFFSPWTA